MTARARVEARDLRKTFAVRHSRRIVTALNGIDLTVPAGALVALVGPDGAGKTTLMRAVCGFITPDGGSLEVLGVNVARELNRCRPTSAICRSVSACMRI